MVVERTLDYPVRAQFLEAVELAVSQRGANSIGDIQPPQGTDTVHAGWITPLLIVGEFEIGPVLHCLLHDRQVVSGINIVFKDESLVVSYPQPTIVEFQIAVLTHQPHVARGEIGEASCFTGMLSEVFFGEVYGKHGVCDDPVYLPKESVLLCR